MKKLTAAFGLMHRGFNLCRHGKHRWLPHKKSAFAGGRAVVEFPTSFVALRQPLQLDFVTLFSVSILFIFVDMLSVFRLSCYM